MACILFLKKNIYLFIWLRQVFVGSCRIFSCNIDSSCGTWAPTRTNSISALSLVALQHVGSQFPDQGRNPASPALQGDSFFFKLFFQIIYLAVPGFNCGICDLVPPPGIEPRPPALGAQTLSHWTEREVSGPYSYSWPAFWIYLIVSLSQILYQLQFLYTPNLGFQP